ncbi:hypothetical protein BDN72DRAFT_958649 [Pluteus cervinus]|uniref:Uncharacterized protein n=1 Tax=Pluteus cervinus TaxID=181527 RepID=A0ACD3AYC5_9AGAR|nr:hypothetical protein BDN72DRAFT_958649 [Pluteus cervinus]
MMSLLKMIVIRGSRQDTSVHVTLQELAINESRAISLDRCPEDVLFHMANYLPWHSLLNFRLVCRHLSSIFAPLTLRNISIGLYDYGFRTEKYYALYSATLPNLYQYAHTLEFRVTKQFDPPEKVLRALWKTLGRFHSLRSLRLIWESESEAVDEKLKNVVVTILRATNGKLERLVLQPPKRSCKAFPKAFQEIRGLTSLTIEHNDVGWACTSYSSGSPNYDCCLFPMKTSITPLLIANPQIEDLAVIRRCMKGRISLNELFYPAFPKLKTLVVSGLWFPSSKSGIHIADTLALLRNLCHLQVLTPYTQSNLDPLCILLKAAHTHLESLATKQISPVLVDYLASFPGLQSLQLRELRSNEDNSSVEVANAFLDEVLPRHAPTLERLVIEFARNITFVPGWSFEADRWAPCISSLTNLRFLAMHPTLIDGTGDSTRTYDTTVIISSYQLIIDHTQNLPTSVDCKRRLALKKRLKRFFNTF